MEALTIPFSPDQDQDFFQKIPASPAVFILRGDGEPYVSKTANLRRRLQRLLCPPVTQTKRLNLRTQVREVEFTLVGSDFESQLLLYRTLRELFPKTYAARLRLRPAPLVKLHLENAYPRASVTTRLGRLTGKNLYYGPFPSRTTAEKFASDALDFFKMRRCVDDLHPDPSFPGCVYSEMKMCLAPCFKGCTDDQYRAEVSRVQSFLDSRGQSLAQELTEKRERASADLAFEDASAIHSRIEKLKPVLAQLPEIVRRIDLLQALIVQPSAEIGSVCLFYFGRAQFVGPVIFRVDGRSEPVHESQPGGPSHLKPETMESRIHQAIDTLAQQLTGSPAHSEFLALLRRWYYRSHRTGEIFLADERGSWPLRRIARGIGRVFRGETTPDIFSATETPSQPS